MDFIDSISIWQGALMASFAIAVLIGRPRFILAFVMVANFAFSASMAASYTSVMIFDLVCAAGLMGRGIRADFVALLFAMMVPIYGLAIFGGWPASTTYAIVEVFSYLQIAIIGGVGHGYIRRNFGADYRCDGSLPTLAERYHLAGIDYPHPRKEKVRGQDLD